jgi:SPP1 family phage portal protein
MMGDFEKVASLIDAYDILLSDVQDEVEEFRLAYLVAYGIEPSEEVMMQARQTGMFSVSEAGGKMEFLTKDLNGDVVEAHKATLKRNIYLFSKTVDMSDELFSGGSQSGESRKWKLLDLENKAITKERKYTRSLKEEVQCINSVWEKKGIHLDTQDIQFQFHRNLPMEKTNQIDAVVKLKDILSKKTLLQQLPFIDVNEELARLEEEKATQVLQTVDNTEKATDNSGV